MRTTGEIPVDCECDTERFRVFVMVDEAKILTAGRGDVDQFNHIVNILATEGRKFGIGLILASQISDHFGHEAQTSAASRLVMKGLPANEASRCAGSLGVPPERLQEQGVPGVGFFKSASTKGVVELKLPRPQRPDLHGKTLI